MLSDRETIRDLIKQAVDRSYVSATLTNGRTPTQAEVTAVFLQSQIATLLAFMLEETEIIEYWRAVITVINEGRVSDALA